jgi:hypothetical protein
VEDDSSEVMNSEAFSDRSFYGNRDAGGNFDEPFDKKPNRLGRNVAVVAPPKYSIDQNSLEPL